MAKQCLRCGATFDDTDLGDKQLTETEKACCPACREKAWGHSRNSGGGGGWFQRLIGRLTHK